MTTIVAAVGVARPSAHAKRIIARSMYEKGSSFLAAAALLQRHSGSKFVVAHLFCQGTELALKGVLLFVDYDKYMPQLRRKKLGHHLDRIAAETLSTTGLPPMKAPLRAELEALSKLYSEHLLRYGSLYDVLVDPATLSIERVGRRVVAMLRLVRRQTGL